MPGARNRDPDGLASPCDFVRFKFLWDKDDGEGAGFTTGSQLKWFPMNLMRCFGYVPLFILFSMSSIVRAAEEPSAEYTEMTKDGTWCWFSDPRAIYRDDKIFAGWMTSDGSVVIGALDVVSGAVRTATLAEKLEKDDHDNPALILLPDGRLAAFYSQHARGDMHLRITTRPGAIDEWTPDRVLGFEGKGRQGITYANPVMLSGEGNAIYLFWRGSNFKPTFSVSKDLGETWSPPQTLLAQAGANDANRPYMKVWSDGKSRIDFAFTDGHPRDEPTNGIGYMRYKGGAFFKADGTRIAGLDALPIEPGRCDRVYDGTSGGRAWIWDIANMSGRPIMAYTRLPEETDHRYHYAHWDGKKWRDSEITAAGKWFPQTPDEAKEREPHYSGGITIDPDHAETVYLSRPVGGTFEIERWRTLDGGQSWNSEPVTRGSEAGNVRPFALSKVPPGDPWLLWMNLDGRYVHYTDYQTSLWLNRSPAPSAPEPLSPAAEPAAVLKAMRRVADWQLAHPSRVRPDDWIPAAGYTGFMALARVSGDAKYRDAMRAISEINKWKLGPRKLFADDHCVGQLYTELFLQEREPRMIAPMRAQFDEILAAWTDGDLDITKPHWGDQWSWCDSLFMAPPAWIRLWAATDDARYLDYAVTQWWRTSDYLYDPKEHLYFRDSTYFTKREANGEKVFWSRGNGWVMGGLVRMLQFLPKDHPSRARFEEQFQEMATRLLALQQDDGMWRSSLLDPESYPLKETSGTSFYCYAFAWGVNHGLIERAKFEPAAARAWAALVGCVADDGRLTHVQPVGADPKHFNPRSTDAFGVGAFLLAGSEMHELAKPVP